MLSTLFLSLSWHFLNTIVSYVVFVTEFDYFNSNSINLTKLNQHDNNPNRTQATPNLFKPNISNTSNTADDKLK